MYKLMDNKVQVMVRNGKQEDVYLCLGITLLRYRLNKINKSKKHI